MINEIITTALEKRKWEVVTTCEEANKDTFDEFHSLLKKMKKHVPLDLVPDLHKIEDFYIQVNTDAVLSAYQLGFEDCRKLIVGIKEGTYKTVKG